MNADLPELNRVFFTHYQCQDFQEGSAIYNMHIFAHGKAREYSDCDEAALIRQFHARVTELQEQGLIAVHWSQNRPYYGPDHIVKRYSELTGESICLEYENDINLSDWLKERFGEDYLPSGGRLDRLARLNNLHGCGETEEGSRIFAANRLLLIKNIYNKVRQNKLVISAGVSEDIKPVYKSKPEKRVKRFEEYFLCDNRTEFTTRLRGEFDTEKGKSIRLLMEALTNMRLLSVCSGQNRSFYLAWKEFFGTDIGTYNSVFNYKINLLVDTDDIEKYERRIERVQEKMEVGLNGI